jgi:preprotein translocase subunit SecF
VRSINTSIIALLPIASILFAGTALLGSGPLKDLALALFVGVAVGAYSSIFIATPLLAGFKEREPAMQALAKRVAARRSGTPTDSPSARRRAAAEAASGPEDADAVPGDEEVREPVPAATTATRPAQPRRPGGTGQGSQRSQPRKGSGARNKSKKRR